MVQIRNPHGQGEWRGAGDSANPAECNGGRAGHGAEAWSDNCRLWSEYPSQSLRAAGLFGAPEESSLGVKRQLLGSDEPKDDGAFWMQWEDFVNFWKGVQAPP